MTARRVGSAILVLAGLAVAVWFVLGLRARHFSDEAQRTAQTVNLQRPAEVQHLEDLYTKASKWNADPAPRIGKAQLDLVLGRQAQGIAALEDVARRNPGNLPSRLILARALAQSGEAARTDTVSAQLRKLYGRVGSLSARVSVRDAKGQILPVVTDWVEGLVDRRHSAPTGLVLSGWAFSRSARAPASEILLYAGGRLRKTVTPTLRRDDIARGTHLPPARYGFVVTLPGKTPPDVELFGVQGGIATAIPLS